MKLLRYGPVGAEKPGILDARGHLRDLSAHVDDIAGAALSAEGLDRLRALNPESLPVVTGSPRIGACVGRIGKFICVGLNYADHAAESGMAVPPEPVLFMKATSAVCGPNDDVIIPKGSEKTDWEVELGIVIGREARYIDEAQAMVVRSRFVHGSRRVIMRRDVTAVTCSGVPTAPQLSAMQAAHRRSARILAMPRNWSASTARLIAIFGSACAGAMPAVSSARR